LFSGSVVVTIFLVTFAIAVCGAAFGGPLNDASTTESLAQAANRPPAAAPNRPAPTCMNSRRRRYQRSSVISE
jgi:hypothetical protein